MIPEIPQKGHVRHMKGRWLCMILLCSIPASADKNRREAEKIVTGIEDSLKRVGNVKQASAGRRNDMDCGVAWTESVLVTDHLGCKVTLLQTGSNVQTCTKGGTTEKLIVSNEWENKISFDLGALNSSRVVLREKKDETLNDFPNTSPGKIYELSFATKRQERAISWSSKLKYISRNAKSLAGGGDVRTDHQEGVWDRLSFSVNNQAEGERLVESFSQAMGLCSNEKK
jgi:hypothetical protein